MSKKKAKNQTSRDLPKKVHASNGAYYYVHKGKWHHLCRVSDGEAEMHRALARVLNPAAHTINELVTAFLSFGMADLKPSTQEFYKKKAKPIRVVFGEVPPNEVTPSDVAQYLELRKQQGKAVSGNREFALLSSVFNYGMRHGMVEYNPCRGVRRNTEKPRRRYIRDDEFRAAFESAPEHMQDLLAVAYLTGLRQKDLRNLKRNQITPQGIEIEESKTGKRLTVEITEALRYFLIRSQSRADSPYVLTNSHGQQWGEWAIQSAMRRLSVDWTFHDLRAKAESDHDKGLGLMPLYKRARKVRPVR